MYNKRSPFCILIDLTARFVVRELVLIRRQKCNSPNGNSLRKRYFFLSGVVSGRFSRSFEKDLVSPPPRKRSAWPLAIKNIMTSHLQYLSKCFLISPLSPSCYPLLCRNLLICGCLWNPPTTEVPGGFQGNCAREVKILEDWVVGKKTVVRGNLWGGTHVFSLFSFPFSLEASGESLKPIIQ